MPEWISSTSEHGSGARSIDRERVKVILDSSSVIGFLHDLRRPDLLTALRNLGMDLILCDSVKGEVERGRTAPLLHACNDLSHNPNHDKMRVEMVGARFPYLGPGEVNVLAWGLHYREERQAYLCVLDDKRARTAAETLHVDKIGVVGLLRLLEERGVLTHDQYTALEARLQQTGFFYHQ